jgi:hypothetical protein
MFQIKFVLVEFVRSINHVKMICKVHDFETIDEIKFECHVK